MPEGAIYAVLKQIRTTTAAITTVSQKILDATFDRKGCIIFNDSDRSCYLTYGPTATIAASTKIVGPYAEWTVPGPAVWCGEISAIRETGTGSLILTEMI